MNYKRYTPIQNGDRINRRKVIFFNWTMRMNEKTATKKKFSKPQKGEKKQ